MPFTDVICKEIMNFYLGDKDYDTTKISSSSNIFPLTKFTNLYLALLTGDPEALTVAEGETDAETATNWLNAITALELTHDPVNTGYERVWLNDKENDEWPHYLAAAGVNPATAEDTKNDADLIQKVGKTYRRGIYNTKEIHFNKAKTDWGTIQGFAIYSAKTNGTLVYYAKLDTPIAVPANGVALFDPGTLKISFAATDVTE